MTSSIFAKTVLFTVLAITVSCTAKSPPMTEITEVEEAKPNYKELFETAYAQLQITSPSQRKEQKPLVLAHYMPWFQKYGFHWQQGGAAFNPEQILPDGRANIASHYYPLTGNYDSADPLVLEYQLALMKIAGIDGVIFDWYGITEGIDYRPIHRATMAMIEMIRKRGFKYAICYEDQSIKHLIDFGVISKDQARSTAKETFEWMERNWFSNAEYVKVDGRPLVLCFGPQYFFQKTEWDEIWAGLKNKPYFIDLDGRTNWADGTKNWSPMHLSIAGKLSITDLVKYLNNFYGKQEDKPFVVGTAVPAFHDIYAQSGGTSYGYLDFSDGETFKLTWTAAEKARSNIIQIQTWNDYGEGTIVEPTIERGYVNLEFIQDKRAERDPDFPFGYGDLRIPIELYKILVNKNATDEQKKQVAAIYDLLFSGDAQGFKQAVRTAGIKFDFSVSPLLMNASEIEQKIQAFDPAGRKNLSLGKPVVSSSKIDVWTAGKSVDGDVSSYWEGAANAWPGTIHVDLVNPVKIKTIVIKLNPQRMWGKRTQRIEVKVGSNGENWTTLLPETDYIFDPETNANTVVIPVDITTQYVQLVFTANTGAGNGQIAELEIYGE